jgi:hypothetical protein
VGALNVDGVAAVAEATHELLSFMPEMAKTKVDHHQLSQLD